MAKCDYWKALTKSKVEAVRRLMDAGEWVIAAEYMGYSLECALKAACCKTLDIDDYPPIKHRMGGGVEEMRFFRTHEFESLLVFSGLANVLGANTMAWGVFTAYYAGDWPQDIRYDPSIDQKFTKDVVTELYDLLYGRDDSILKTIFKAKRW